VLAYDRPLKADLHPTMKPVALLERLLRDGSMDGALVLDCFAGSGSTLVACEASHRSARMIEVEPQYADVCVARWQTLTGQRALLNGEPQDAIT
jgi:DNA modification methylase